MRFRSPASKKWLEKSLRGFLGKASIRRFILNRRRYNKAVGGITKPQGVYKQQKVSSIGKLDTVTTGFISSRRIYYISDDLIYFRQFKRTLESFFRVSQSLLHTFSPTGAFLCKKRNPQGATECPLGKKNTKSFERFLRKLFQKFS